MMAVSWELPPTRIMILPERRCKFANRFKNGTDNVELRTVHQRWNLKNEHRREFTRYGPLALS